MKKALILAAGAGKRLGTLTKDLPKCLLEIDPESKKTLLDFSLEALKGAGIQKIVIVNGFAKDRLDNHIKNNWQKEFSFEFIFNNKFAEYNNIYSAYLAKDIWDDETILLNSDIIFHPDILKDLSSQLPVLSSFLVIDNTKELTLEAMKVKVNSNGEIKEINKNLDIEGSFGEYIGIIYLRGQERIKFLESLEKNIKNRSFDLYYEDALGHVLNEVSIYPYSTKEKPWTEVDTQEDYEIAKQIAKEIKKEERLAKGGKLVLS